MTRLAILSDIHGNLPALEAVILDMAHFTIDHVIVAGDIINWGPFSQEVIERVTREGWATIRGNNEFYLLDYNTPRAPAHWHDFTLLPWLHRQLAGRWHNLIAAWPDTLSLRYPDAPPLRVVHGSPRSAWEAMFPHEEEAVLEVMLAGVEESTIVAGHSHIAMDRFAGSRHLLNPGSVGIPLDGIFSASYMLLDGGEHGWRPTFRRIPFDYEPLFREFVRQRFVEECGVTGHLVVEEFRTAQLWVHPFYTWRLAQHHGTPASMELLAEFEKVNKWEYSPPAYHVDTVQRS